MRWTYRQEVLRSFQILKAQDTDPAAARVDAALLLTRRGEWALVYRRYRMVYLNGAGQPLDRDRPEGRWIPHAVHTLPGPPPLRA